MVSKVAIITARGGSKRIPRKNIRDFLGKPIISYSIESALESNLFDRVIVSTDDEEIAETSKSFGAEVPFMRSKENSDDYATTTDVLFEVIQSLKDNKQSYDFGCCIYPTAPFTTKELLQRTWDFLIEQDKKNLIPITPFSFPIQRALKVNPIECSLSPFDEANFLKRSQDLEASYHDCGMFYWFNINEFLSTKSILTEKTVGFKVNPNYCQDIDNEDDWKLAELKYQLMAGTLKK